MTPALPDDDAGPSTPAQPATATGRVPPDAIRLRQLPRLPAPLLDGFRELGDLTGAVSDAMDKLGLAGAVPASELRPNLPARRLVGQALTVRNVERQEGVARSVAANTSKMGELEAYALAEPGDVVVIQGLLRASNMGGQSARLAHRAGCAGAIIDGAHRDPDVARDIGLPLWVRGVTPITGKWRLETAEINGPVQIAGVQVRAGDLVVADEAGVVFVPRERAADVLAEAQRIDRGDRLQQHDIAAGMDIGAMTGKTYK